MTRAFIFDLDGTLYPRDSNLYRAMSASTTRWFKTHLREYGDFASYYEKMKRDYPNPLEAIQALGLSTASYHKEVFDALSPEHYLFDDTGAKYALTGLIGSKFLVTLASRGHSDRVLRALDIHRDFSGIYNPGTNWHTCQLVDA